MDVHCLHIWPRRYYMLMGLANQDGSFTGTLFMPHKALPSARCGLRQSAHRSEADRFLRTHFPDAYDMMPDMTEQYMRNPQSNLGDRALQPVDVHGDTAALIGDAAHAIVPFYGEGMNAGYEDCKVLNDLLDEHGDDNWGAVLDAYGKPNAWPTGTPSRTSACATSSRCATWWPTRASCCARRSKGTCKPSTRTSGCRCTAK
jgi:kynurenine 3-monooxygenase